MECQHDDVVEVLSEAVAAPDTNLTGISANLRRTTIGNATPYREDDRTEYGEVLCSSDIQREAADSRSYRVHPLVRMCTSSSGWSDPIDVDCYHCCEPIQGPAVRIPQSVDPQGIFMVRPTVFCSLPCAKAHLLERNAFDCSVQLVLLHRVARDVYGWTSAEIPTAPPRLCLRRFGGPLTISEFRRSVALTGMRVIDPPFVPLQMMVESSGVVGTPDLAPKPKVVQLRTKATGVSDDEDSDESDNEEVVDGRSAIPAWSVRGLRRPEQPRCLPRADPAAGPSLLESYVASVARGEEWRADEYRGTGVVTSKTPSVEQVNRALNTTMGAEPLRRTLPTVAVTEPKRRQSRRAKRHQSRMPSNHELAQGQTLLSFADDTPQDQGIL